MDVETRIEDHEARIHRLEDGQDDIRDRINSLSDQIKDGNARNDESNKYLREQNTEVIRMLGGIQQKKQEAHISIWQAIGKLAIPIGGVVTLATILVNFFFSK
ncbi:hypothetical protein [Sporolactobacillus pectinivorans]|uniref:hypothetical protein n=1 Tax=Sporolactobacillus pectinivorans TaxID=1591408 RepID=UPI000C259AAA|nr:hypothetical protein [Sporolactobacillus pectinivorans]